MRLICIICVFLCPFLVHAQGLTLPPALLEKYEQTIAKDTVKIPTNLWHAGALQARSFTGTLTNTVLQGQASMDLNSFIADMEQQLAQKGYTPLLLCSSRNCGGFDFRFALNIVPPPDMYVDIANYVFLSAEIQADGRGIYIIASQSSAVDYVQITSVTPANVAVTVKEQPILADVSSSDIEQALLQDGHFPLRDLGFETGTADLSGQFFASLDKLAGYLSSNPKARIAVVGHTDNVGSLSGNMSLSKRRAESVRRMLTRNYNISGARVEAQGVAYLSPLATNDNAEGRAKNRRVEVVLLTAK